MTQAERFMFWSLTWHGTQVLQVVGMSVKKRNPPLPLSLWSMAEKQVRKRHWVGITLETEKCIQRSTSVFFFISNVFREEGKKWSDYTRVALYRKKRWQTLKIQQYLEFIQYLYKNLEHLTSQNEQKKTTTTKKPVITSYPIAWMETSKRLKIKI